MKNRWTMVGVLAGAMAFGACDGPAEVDGGPGDGGDEADTGTPPLPDSGPRDGGPDTGTPPPADVLPRPSRTTTVDISPDDSLVAMVNRGAGSVSIFATSDNSRVSVTPTGGQPSAVVFHPNGTTAYVANQADGTVVEVTGIGTASPSVARTVTVGSEPTGLALSPTGALLFVAEWGESRVSSVATGTMTVAQSFAVPSPYALAVTNDGDEEDLDESLVVPEFFGRPNAAGEANNEGRTGHVHIRSLGDLETVTTPITLDPIDSTFGTAGSTDMTSPNQLSGVTIAGTRAYITSVSASPAAPVAFNRNVHPVVYVIDLTAGAEDTSATGSANLAALVRDQIPSGSTRHFLADIVGVSFVGATVAYVVSRGADVVQRLDYSGADIQIGSAMNDQIDVGPPPAGATSGCQTPTGIVTTHGAPNRAFLNCWVTRNLGVVNLGDQALTTVVESTAPPSTPEEIAVNRGLRFFHTGRGRWSSESWSACSSCHPGGLTDNITWSFAAGPRQSTSLDGSFSHGPGPQQHRIFNWSAIFDEVHDFERNTRGVSGGLGAIVRAAPGSSCGMMEERIDIAAAAPVGAPLKELQDMGCTNDWDEIEDWMRTIRPPHGRSADAASITRGRAVFMDGNCARCHGGAGWTASRRFWTPSTANNSSLTTTAFVPPTTAGWVATWNTHTFQIQAEQPGGAGPPHVSCVLRNIGTFGVRNADGTPNATATAALEVRDTGAGAQGSGGYNIPSLYGLQLGAPYLHHGQAASLDELLDPNGRWVEHLRAGNAVFLVGDTTGADRADLINYLMSIDADTTEIPIPAGFDACPTTFP